MLTNEIERESEREREREENEIRKRKKTCGKNKEKKKTTRCEKKEINILYLFCIIATLYIEIITKRNLIILSCNY